MKELLDSNLVFLCITQNRTLQKVTGM